MKRPSLVGLTVRNYRIVTELGNGSMGTVYYGEHELIGRRAAIKVLHPDIAVNDELVERFFVEARAVNSIRHPHIVDITDCGRAHDFWFLIMEFLEGETLGARLEVVRTFSENETMRVLNQVASALGAVHEHGIVHRDLKPENIFLTNFPDYPDFVKVLDFGVVKVADSERSTSVLRTQPGMLVGTPAYMSPEQCLGDENLDHRSDIYSLGVVAFQLLTGHMPFEGSVTEVLRGHLTQNPVPPRSLAEDLTPEANDLVLWMLAKRPEDRPQTMRELREAVRRLLTGESPVLKDLSSSPQAAPAPSAAKRKKAREMVGGGVPAGERVLTPDELARKATTDKHVAENVVERLRDIIARRLLSNSVNLPPFPAVATKCFELARNPQTKFSTLAQVIEREPMVVSRVMRLANGPVYGGAVRATTVEAAISRLGIQPLTLVLQEMAAAGVFSSRNPRIRSAFRAIWEHCLAVAELSRRIAIQVTGGPAPDVVYLAGLFHDIGKPIIATLLLEAERGLVGPETEGWMNDSVWSRVVEACHAEVATALATRWNLPGPVILAVASHDAFDFAGGRSSCTNVVRLANALCIQAGLDLNPGEPERQMVVIKAAQRIFGLTDIHLEHLADGLKEHVEAITTSDERSSSESTHLRGKAASF